MIITIWRHGEAHEGAIDRRRELTSSGCDDVGFGCRQFQSACSARKISQPTGILYSPWVRTTQTAKIIAAAFTHASSTAEAALQPGGTISEVDQALADVIATDFPPAHVLLVSHQPLVSHLIDHYLGQESAVPSLSPGSLVTLSLDVPASACGTLLFWALPPQYEACR
jgi:phosphohistidine phosphatase